MNGLISLLLVGLLFSCASTTKKGDLVEVVPVDGSGRQISKAKKDLEKDGCKFLQKVEAGIAVGYNGDATDRLIIGLKNKVAEIGGNAVITSLKSHGFPLKTNGLAYECPFKNEDTSI